MKSLHILSASILMLATFSSFGWSQEVGEVQQVVEIQTTGDALGEGGAFFVPELLGNEATIDVVADDGDGDGVVVMSSSTSFGDVGDVTFGEIPFGDSGFFGKRSAEAKASELMSLLQNKSVREEIELIDSQYQKMRDFQDSRTKEMRKAMKGLFSGGKIDPNGIKAMIEKSQAESSKQLEEMLLPHQVARLRQVSRQVRMQSRGTAQTLTSSAFAKELGLTDEQKSDFREKAAEIEKRVKAEIAKLKSDARKELVGTLPSDKQEKLKELIGEEFEYQKPDMKSRLNEIRKQMEDRITEKRIKES